MKWLCVLLATTGCNLYWSDDPGDGSGYVAPLVDAPPPTNQLVRPCMRALAGGDFAVSGFEEIAITYVCDCCGITEGLRAPDRVLTGVNPRGDYQDRFRAIIAEKIDDDYLDTAIHVGEHVGGTWIFSGNGGNRITIERGFDDMWIGDLDGDGKRDYLMAGDNAIRMASAYSQPYQFPLVTTAADETDLLTGKPFRYVAHAQLGGSSAPDVFYVTTGGELGVAVQSTSSSGPTFTVVDTKTDPGGSVLPLVTADFDGDGIDDVAGAAGHVFVRSSKTGQIAFLDQGARALAAGDVDNDGRKDLIFISANGAVTGRVNVGANGALTSQPLLPHGGDGLAVADLDGDHHADIVLVDHLVPPGYSPPVDSTITMYAGASL